MNFHQWYIFHLSQVESDIVSIDDISAIQKVRNKWKSEGARSWLYGGCYIRFQPNFNNFSRVCKDVSSRKPKLFSCQPIIMWFKMYNVVQFNYCLNSVPCIVFKKKKKLPVEVIFNHIGTPLTKRLKSFSNLYFQNLLSIGTCSKFIYLFIYLLS